MYFESLTYFSIFLVVLKILSTLNLIILFRIRMRASVNCTTSGLPRALEILNRDDDVKNTIQITQLMKVMKTGLPCMKQDCNLLS